MSSIVVACALVAAKIVSVAQSEPTPSKSKIREALEGSVRSQPRNRSNRRQSNITDTKCAIAMRTRCHKAATDSCSAGESAVTASTLSDGTRGEQTPKDSDADN